MSPERVVLVASSDDYLLEEAMAAEIEALASALGGAPVSELPADATPELAAVELTSPSLFDPQRVLVGRDVRGWIGVRPAPGETSARGGDLEPLIAVLKAGIPEGVGLVLGAVCPRRPSGPLVKALREAGRVEWISLPPEPKPWEDVAFSREQLAVLRRVIRRAAGDAELEEEAEALLLERLGFAPRLLAQEVRKLAAAAGPAGRIGEDLVRRLVIPAGASLEAVRDAVRARDLAPVMELFGKALAGVPVRDWRGRTLSLDGLAVAAAGRAAGLFETFLYLRRAAAAAGCAAELDPAAVSRDRWYQSRFQGRGKIGEKLLELIRDDELSPYAGRPKPPSAWVLGQDFMGAARYGDAELVRALAAAGEVEAATRGDLGLEAVTAWLADVLGAPAAAGA